MLCKFDSLNINALARGFELIYEGDDLVCLDGHQYKTGDDVSTNKFGTALCATVQDVSKIKKTKAPPCFTSAIKNQAESYIQPNKKSDIHIPTS